MSIKEPFIQTSERILMMENWTSSNPTLIVGFSTKQGGVSQEPYKGLNVGFHVKDDPEKVRINRQLVADELGFPLSTWVIGEQVHQGELAKVTNAHRESGAYSHGTTIPDVDGLYTSEHDILLVSLYADCVPLYFYVPSKQIVGLAHAGWKGTVENIAENMISTFVEKEAIELEDIHVAIGPSISQSAYEVNEAIIQKVEAVLPSRSNEVAKKVAENKYLLDLNETNKQLLIAAGVKKEQITVTNYCTSMDEALFYSYRRDNQVTGRMMSFIGLKS